MSTGTLVEAKPGADGRYPTSVAGSTFYFDELAAPILYLSPTQAAVVAPSAIAGRPRVSVTLENAGKRTAPLVIAVSASNPGVFTANSSGSGLVAAQNVAADGTISTHTLSNPALRGGVITIYATGLGVTTPLLVDGALTGAALPSLDNRTRVLVGGREMEVLYAGPAPGLIAGLMQINIRLSTALSTGELPLLVVSDENPSQPGVTIAVR
jgi:uncharacterized protein (TIGR03437 family)